jgi:hypothetical protein
MLKKIIKGVVGAGKNSQERPFWMDVIGKSPSTDSTQGRSRDGKWKMLVLEGDSYWPQAVAMVGDSRVVSGGYSL